MGVAAAPSLAWNGTEWLLAFHQAISLPADSPFCDTDYHTFAVRLSPALALLDPTPIELGPARQPLIFQYGIDAHAASAGGDFMVVMTHVESADGVNTRQTILIRGIHADGSLDVAPRRLGDGIGLDITADRGRYAVAIATSAVPAGFQQFSA